MGCISKFTAENYYVYLYTYLFDVETVFTFFTKNIYFVCFLRNVNSLLITLSNNLASMHRIYLKSWIYKISILNIEKSPAIQTYIFYQL